MVDLVGQKTGGRAAGTPNKVTPEIRALARAHGPEALNTLVALLRGSESEQVKVAAAKEILDRAYGKAHQTIDATVKNETDLRNVSTAELLARADFAGADSAETGNGESGSLH